MLSVVLAKRPSRGACNKCAIDSDDFGVLEPVSPLVFKYSKFKVVMSPNMDNKRCLTWHFGSAGFYITYNKKGTTRVPADDSEFTYTVSSQNSMIFSMMNAGEEQDLIVTTRKQRQITRKEVENDKDMEVFKPHNFYRVRKTRFFIATACREVKDNKRIEMAWILERGDYEYFQY
jgi:hypothetical protein